MIIIDRKIGFINLTHIFLNKEHNPNLAKKKIVVHVYSRISLQNFKEGVTYHIDLQKDKDELLKKMSKMNRYMLRRAEKEPYEFIVIENPTDDNLKEFQRFYNKFILTKKTNNINNFRLNTLKLLRNKGALVFTKLQNINGEALCYQIHIIDEDLVLNLYTCTAAWIQNRPDLKQQIRFANRYLLWRNILFFKKRGFKIYDFGGRTEISQINKFKEDFGFEEVPTYHGHETQLIVGEIIVNLNNLKNVIINKIRRNFRCVSIVFRLLSWDVRKNRKA